MKIHVGIFIASRILGRNRPIFSPQDIVNFISKEFNDDRPGIKTHVNATCVANTALNHPIGYNYLWRIGHGEYRPFRPDSDQPKPERAKHRTQPNREDVPEKYRFLLSPE